MPIKSFGKSKAPQPEMIRLIPQAMLPSLGVCYHANHLRRMWLRGEFPKPIYLSPRKLAWREEDIRAWVEKKVAAA